jgi:1-acyl-sn-glycerol-3-phosphate acyltransferase
MNLFFNAIGGVAVDRTKKNSVTQQMVDEFNARESFHLAITPEGTRKLVDDWKMGFYYIALGANVPIQIAYIDFAKKEVGIKALFYPTGDEKADIETIKSYYKGITGKFPERFNL